jgi:hypothetical protein
MKILTNWILPGLCALYLSLTLGHYLIPSIYVYIFLGLLSFTIIKYCLNVFSKKYVETRIDQRGMLVGVGVSILLISASGNYLIPQFDPAKKRVDITIIASGKKSSKSNASEVWILGIKNNGSAVDLNGVSTDSGWKKKEGKIASYEHQPDSLHISLENGSNSSIRFLKHSWSGFVRIKTRGDDKTIDLYQEGPAGEYIYSVNPNDENSSRIKRASYLLALIFFTVIVSTLYITIRKQIGYYYVFNCLLWFVLFVLSENLSLDEIQVGLLLVVSVLFGKIFSRAINSGFFKEFIGTRYFFVFLLIALYGGFACVGNTLFLLDTKQPITFQIISYYLLFVLWFLPIAVSFLYITYRLKKAAHQSFENTLIDDRAGRLRFWLLLFSILVLAWSIYLFAFFPGVMSSDSLDQWGQALGVAPLNDWHPVFHTLTNRLLVSIYKSPATIAFSQILFMALVTASFLLFLYEQGIPKKWLLSFTLVFAIIPVNGIYVITLWKYLPFTISLLWLTLLLVKIIVGKSYPGFKSWDFPALIIALLSVALFRHNGVVIYFLAALGLLYHAIRIRNKAVIACVVISVICFATYSMFKNAHVTAIAPGVKFIAPTNAVAAVMKEDTLPSDLQRKMEAILPEEQWNRLYSAYSANGLQFQTDDMYVKNLSALSSKDAIKMYCRAFSQHPFLVIRDRLQGTDFIWNVSKPKGVHNTFYNTDLEPNNFGLTQEKASFKKVLLDYLKISESLGSIFLWRVGIYNIFILLLVFFALKTGSKKHLLLFLPWFGGIISLIPSLAWQEFRYVYFIFFLFGFLWLTIISKVIELPEQKKSINKRVQLNH